MLEPRPRLRHPARACRPGDAEIRNPARCAPGTRGSASRYCSRGARSERYSKRAASDLRSVASYTALLIAQDIADPSRRRPGAGSVRGARARRSRVSLRIALVLPVAMRGKLEAAAREEMRSVSSYVARVIV